MKRIFLVFAVLCVVLCLFSGCDRATAGGQTETNLPDTTAPDTLTPSGDPASLKEPRFDYLDLDASAGLDVIVWQMAPSHYAFGLLPHSQSPHELTELLSLGGVNAKRMRTILSAYEIEEDEIFILPWQNPVSSYIGEVWIVREGEDRDAKAEAYIAAIREMLFCQSEQTDAAS